MSDEGKNAGDAGTATAAASLPPEQPLPDEHTTVPNPPVITPATKQAGSGKWEMPKPKFQQTSGYLPQGYLKNIEQDAAIRAAGSEDTTQEQAPFVPVSSSADGGRPAPLPAIEPQPDLSEQLLLPEDPVADATPTPAAKTGGLSVVGLVLGFVAILAFVAIFVAVVYFLLLGGSIF